ncbi:MAG: ATPase, T2SS/T4P/T4SS family [Bacillota bacterium]|nr:ATPase, T2SS/T4P/T4SS family [Bacillota bacterium]
MPNTINLLDYMTESKEKAHQDIESEPELTLVKEKVKEETILTEVENSNIEETEQEKEFIPSPVLNLIDVHKYSYGFRAEQAKSFSGKKKVSNAILDQVRDVLSQNHKKLFQESIIDRVKRQNLSAIVAEYISNTGIIVQGYTADELIKIIVDSLAGLDVLEDLIDNENITDINVNGKNEIWVEELGKGYYLSDLKFANDEALYAVCMKIVNASGESLTSAKPYVDCRFPGMRINIVSNHICGLGMSISIRKFAKSVRITDETMVQTKQASQEMVKSLEAFVKGKMNMLIVGSTGSGKTELLKYLVKHIPDSQRMIMLEDTAETRLKDIYPDKHILPMECRFTADEETTVDYVVLLKNALRQNPVRIGVGECRGSEAVYMIEIFNTGHEGGFTTVHANSAPDAAKRLVMMCLRSGMKLDSDVIGKWVSSTFNIVIFQEKMEDGGRRISEIIELIDYKNDEPVYNTLFELQVEKFEREGEKVKSVQCHHEQKGYLRQDTVKQLLKRGIQLELFDFLINPEDKEVLGID